MESKAGELCEAIVGILVRLMQVMTSDRASTSHNLGLYINGEAAREAGCLDDGGSS